MLTDKNSKKYSNEHPRSRNKKIKNYQDAKKRDEAKTNIPMKTNGPSMEQKFKEKTIAKVKDMVSAAKRDKEKIK